MIMSACRFATNARMSLVVIRASRRPPVRSQVLPDPVLCEYSAVREVPEIVSDGQESPCILNQVAPLRDASALHSLPRPLAFLLLLVSGWVNRQQQAVIDDLLEENRILRDTHAPDGYALPTTSAAAWL
jgi:hypothetical protein